MRHRSSSRHFNRDTKARKALISSLVINLAEQGEIVVTKPMAKEAARHLDKLIVRAKKADLASRRVLHTYFGKRALVNLFVDQIAPSMQDRDTGFTSITFFGNRRGDNAQLYTLKFVNEIQPAAVRTASKFPEKKTAAKAAPIKAAPQKAAPKAAAKKEA